MRTEFPLWRHAAWDVRVHDVQVSLAPAAEAGFLRRLSELNSCAGSTRLLPFLHFLPSGQLDVLDVRCVSSICVAPLVGAAYMWARRLQHDFSNPKMQERWLSRQMFVTLIQVEFCSSEPGNDFIIAFFLRTHSALLPILLGLGPSVRSMLASSFSLGMCN